MERQAIGVFDSGLGGLSAVKQLIRLAPEEDIVYFGDTARVPYGNRSSQTITRYAKQAIAFLISKKVKMLINACGTMSAVLPESFTDSLPVAYFDVITPTAVAAVSASTKGNIGIIATTATINSSAFQKAINRINPDFRTVSKACPLFVPLVENGYIASNNPVTRLVAEEYLAQLRESEIDALILGCTHYPLISELISDVIGREVTLIDSGYEAAAAAMVAIKDTNETPGELVFFTSDNPPGFSDIAGMFLGRKIDNITQIDIESVDPYRQEGL